jgi:hypothetical protein
MLTASAIIYASRNTDIYRGEGRGGIGTCPRRSGKTRTSRTVSSPKHPRRTCKPGGISK